MTDIQQLLEIMQQLRNPDGGCPWDLQQTNRSLIPFTLEEAYEVADAIERNDSHDLKSELGDLLFQVVFYAQIASEENQFSFNDVVQAICDKLVRRHPHVFADATVKDAESQTREWEAHKQKEREARQLSAEPVSHLDDISRSLPAIMRAEKLQRRAARVGFDWPDVKGVMSKLQEETAELQQAMAGKNNEQSVHEEMGDLLFTCINLARHLGINAEMSLRDASHKFEQRFRMMELALRDRGSDVEKADAQLMDEVWNEIKQQ